MLKNLNIAEDHTDIEAKLDAIAGGTFWGAYGPRNVEVDNEVDFGIMILDPAGNIVTTGEITPGTYTVHRIRVAVDTEIVSATASSEAAGRVYMTYDFPAASWNVGDIFYVVFSGIKTTIDETVTEYPDLYIWGRVVREADISSKIDTIDGMLDVIEGAVGVFHEQADVPVDISAIVGSETDVLYLHTASTRYILRSLRLKSADPGENTITVRLKKLVNDGLTTVDTFDIDSTNYATNHSLMDIFALPQIAGDEIRITVQVDAGEGVAITGQYSYGKTNQ